MTLYPSGAYRFWSQIRSHLRRGRILRINPLLVAINFVRDTRLTIACARGLAAAK